MIIIILRLSQEKKKTGKINTSSIGCIWQQKQTKLIG